MKKVLAVILFTFSLSLICTAETSLELLPFSSLRNSCTTEDLFFSGTFGTDSSKICSELLWNEKFAISTGIDSFFTLANKKSNFIFRNGIYVSLPFNKGKMTDTDWNAARKKSDYSEFNNNIVHAFEVWTGFCWQIKFNSFKAGPLAEVKYSELSFNAKNIFGWTDLDSSSPHYYPDGKKHLADINYKSRKAAIFTGLNAEKTFMEKVTVSISAKISPFTFVFVQDRHTGRNYTFEDYVYSYFSNYELTSSLSYKITDRMSAYFSFLFNYFSLTKCDEYYKWDESSHDTLSSQKAGYSYYSYEITSGLKIKVF
jgi:outer membrane protease